ncbi:MAG: hypothetical protein MUO76_14925 [Anaerolineaceae bacterium]|nr:hypothetical protein [Anaerolineaceae bacterium]
MDLSTPLRTGPSDAPFAEMTPVSQVRISSETPGRAHVRHPTEESIDQQHESYHDLYLRKKTAFLLFSNR